MAQAQKEFEEKQQAVARRLSDWNQRRFEALRDRTIRERQRALQVRRRRLKKAEAKENKITAAIARTEFRNPDRARKMKAMHEAEMVADQWLRSYIARQNVAQSQRRNSYLGERMIERERKKDARLDEIKEERNRQRDIRMRQMNALLTRSG
jgi:hypothetical protein